jgi:hypothetical protein
VPVRSLFQNPLKRASASCNEDVSNTSLRDAKAMEIQWAFDYVIPETSQVGRAGRHRRATIASDAADVFYYDRGWPRHLGDPRDREVEVVAAVVVAGVVVQRRVALARRASEKQSASRPELPSLSERHRPSHSRSGLFQIAVLEVYCIANGCTEDVECAFVVVDSEREARGASAATRPFDRPEAKAATSAEQVDDLDRRFGKSGPRKRPAAEIRIVLARLSGREAIQGQPRLLFVRCRDRHPRSQDRSRAGGHGSG